MVMEDVDLGRDRTNLIDFIYGKRDAAESVSPSVDTPALSESSEKVIIEKKKKQPKVKKPAKRVSCTSGKCLCFLLLALFAILFAAFLGYYITKQEYESMNHQVAEPVAACNFSRPQKRPNRPIVNQEDADENDVVKQPTKEELALPKAITPVWYKVSLSPKAGGSDGVAMVKLNITEPTNKIVLNSKGIDFTKNLEKIQISKEQPARQKRSSELETTTGTDAGNSTTIEPSTDGSGEIPTEASSTEQPKPKEEEDSDISNLVDSGIRVTGIEIDENLEKAVLTLDKELKKGSDVVLKIPFVSKSTNNDGLKEYKYKTPEGEQSMFTTQPNYAYMRHVFPSFDQQGFKAPAALTLMHSKGSVVVANTNVRTKDDGDSRVSTLAKTYDPDFVIGDLVASELNTTSGVTIRLWTRPEVQDSAKLALNYADQALDAMEHILQSRTESKQLDIVAVPGFETGSRVSNSFIVLPEEDILFNEQSNDITQKARILRRLANRIAAQWFGGITNPEEYGTFWLNDALPKYLEVEALERVLKVDSDNLWTYELEDILEKDSTATSRPLRVKNVHSSANIGAIDHEFIGEKGAAVLRMVEKSVGKDEFNKAIRSFVSSYRSSYPYDDGLWTSFEKAINGKFYFQQFSNKFLFWVKGWNGEKLDVGKFVNTWVDQVGYPLVSVNKLNNENIEISQERYKNDEQTTEDMKNKNAKYWFNWEVPLFVQTNGDVGDVDWLHEAFRLPFNASDSILLNSDSNGLYRVNYEEKRWNAIAKQLETDHKKFSERTRARLLSDSFALANSGVLPFETALNITSYLPKESGTVPWLIATDNFKKLSQRVEGTPLQDKLNEAIYAKLANKFEDVSEDPDQDDYLKSLLRANLFDLVSHVKPGKSNKRLGELFESGFLKNCQGSANYSSECSEVPGDFREKVYCNGIEFGNDSVFETVKLLADKEIDGKEKEVLTDSLACFRDPRALRKLIFDNLNSTSATVQLLKKMNERPVGREVATNFIIDNWSTLKKKFKDDPDSLNSIVDAGVVLENERQKSMIENFVDHHHKSTSPIGSFERKLESGTSDIYWRKQRNAEISDYLNGKMKGPAKDEQEKNSEEEE